MADNTVWMTIASVLATLTLRKAKDMEGNEIDIPEEYTSNFFRYVAVMLLSCTVSSNVRLATQNRTDPPFFLAIHMRRNWS